LWGQNYDASLIYCQKHLRNGFVFVHHWALKLKSPVQFLMIINEFFLKRPIKPFHIRVHLRRLGQVCQWCLCSLIEMLY
jgi:hypothetical protein